MTRDDMIERMASEMSYREGDIVRWRLIKPYDYLDYWAKSRIAVYRNGRFLDTFWHSGGDNYALQLDRVELEPVANFDEIENRGEYEADYYDEADIVNLNHSNSSKGNFYIRKGAQRSRAKMVEVAQYKKERAEADLRSAANNVGRYEKIVEQLSTGEPLEGIYL